jgi:hypothetical protein
MVAARALAWCGEQTRTVVLKSRSTVTWRRVLEQPLSCRIDVSHATIEIEEQDAEGRHIKDLAEEVLLLLEMNSLLAQTIAEAVEKVDHAIDLGLPDLADTGHEIAVVEQLLRLADK